MGLVYESIARPAAPVTEPIKEHFCPLMTWSYEYMFDPDSEEFFADAITDKFVNDLRHPPAPLSPIDSASTSDDAFSNPSGRASPESDGPIDADDVVFNNDELRRMSEDVRNLTWLAQVPPDAHDPVGPPRVHPAAPSLGPPRTRSISDAPTPMGWSLEVGTARVVPSPPENHGLVIPPPVRRAQRFVLEPALAAELAGEHQYSEEVELVSVPVPPSTPPPLPRWEIPQTPASASHVAPSPPPSVTPRVFTYEHAVRNRISYLPMPQSPTLMTRARIVPAAWPAAQLST